MPGHPMSPAEQIETMPGGTTVDRKVSRHDQNVPIRIKVPVVKGSVQQMSQLLALKRRMRSHIRQVYGWRSARAWNRMTENLEIFSEHRDREDKNPPASYEDQRIRIQYLINLFINDFVRDVEEIVKGAT